MSGTYDEVRYQVFVSSTFTDLKEEREKVLQAILECKAFPAGMELFPSADDEQFEFIKREIDSSDYYLVIIAGRYGSRADDGVGFTEKEFDYALAQGKPILAFLIKDPSKLEFHKCEAEAEGRARLEQFKEKAKKSRLVKHYSNPDELKSQVLQSLNYQFRVDPKRGWIPAGQSKREDLEEIRGLLNKVISLEAENGELRSSRNEAAARLGQGQDAVSWAIDVKRLVSSLRLDGSESATEISFPPDVTQLHTNWDELLSALYFGGSSRLDSADVEPRLFLLLASKIPDQDLRGTWREIAVEDLARRRMDLTCLRSAKRDIYRQFTGLGLIEEVLEDRYKEPMPDYSLMMNVSAYLNVASSFPQPKSDPIPYQVVVWRLTRRGEEQLALLRGFRRIQPS
jgi:nucleoside 2-deoxyribosyltransferase